MGIPQDEVDLPDTLGLTLTAGMLPHMTLYSFPGQTPIVPFTPSTRYDFTNPTTTTKHLQISSTTKASQSSHIVIPLYAVVPLPSHQVRAPPPQPVPSPHPLGPAFWDVVERTVDYSVHGTLAMVWLLLAIAEAISQKDLAFLRDSQTSSSCDPFDLDSLPFIPTEDDLLRVDVSGLESIPSSELYLGEEDLMAAAPATPRPFSNKAYQLPPPRSRYSDTTLPILREGYLPSEGLSALLQIPDSELYFNPRRLDKLGPTPPWPFNSSAITAPTPLSCR